VTGDVPGGRGFRGSVGYTAAGDFQGQLGSDDLFPFLADSAFSAPAFVRYGNTAEQLRFGQAIGTLTYRRERAPTAMQQELRATTLQRPEDRTLTDQVRVDWLMKASTTPELQTRAVEPRVVGVQYVDKNPEPHIWDPDYDQPLIVDASSLRGVTQVAAKDDLQSRGLTTFDGLRIEQDAEATGRKIDPGEPFRVEVETFSLLLDPEMTEPADPVEDERRLQFDVAEDYQRVMTRLVERFAQETNVDWTAQSSLETDLREIFDQIREELGAQAPESVVPGFPGTDEDETTEPDEGEVRDPFDRTGPEAMFPLPGRQDEDEEATDEPPSLEDFGLILRHGERIDQLASGGDARFNEHLKAAEQFLQDGKYFWAERRFIRALRFVPGHPLATAGLGHAQLGAGLYASAALTLRELFTFQPEMIDVRYADTLLPNEVRLQRAIEEIRAQARNDSAEGFLLAYLGHQTESPALVEEGLQRMTKGNPRDPMPDLLRGVWLAD
jgi:hypothetical protein